MEAAAETRRFAGELRRWCERVVTTVGANSNDLRELALAARFTELFADKVAFAHHIRTPASGGVRTRDDRHTWGEELMEASGAYADCWRAGCKPSGLDDILRALSSAADELHR
jgi:hypothetical protein